jgi:vanillate O-demethylase monooxygenase subunit
MKVKQYPCVEKDKMIYVWFGEGEPTKPAPDWLDHGQGYGGELRGHLNPGCNYKFIVDNIFDNAHSVHLHDFLSTTGLVQSPIPTVEERDGELVSDAHIMDTPPNQLFAPMIGRPGNVDQFHRARWMEPSAINLRVGVVESGGNYDDQIGTNSTHMITPETETSCHYFWMISRNALLEDHSYTEKLKQGINHIFTTEDVWMLEGQQRLLGDDEFWERKPVLLPQDKASAVVRRKVEALEQQSEEIPVRSIA